MVQTTSQKKANPLWFSGICDELLAKVGIWDKAYWFGEVHSTRQFLDSEGKVVDKPTRCAHDIPLRLQELEHLVRIIETLRPGSQIVDELREVQKIWKYGKPVQGFRYIKSYWTHFVLPSGLHRIVTLAFYPEHVKEILNLLTEAKTGQKKTTIQAAVDEKKEQGKDLFEE